MPLLRPKLLLLLDLLVIAATLFALGVCAFVPVWSDEIGYTMVFNRLHTDGTLQYFFPTCTSSFRMQPPLEWRPLLRAGEILYTQLGSTALIRLIGVISAIGTCCALAFLGKRLTELHLKSKVPFTTAFALTLMTVGFGYLPVIFVINRPEHGMLWCIIIALFCMLFRLKRGKKTGIMELALFTGFMLVTLSLLSRHPKAILFVPFFVVAIVRVFPRRIALIGISGTIFFASRAYHFFSMRNQCAEDPALLAKLEGELLTPWFLAAEPAQFAQRVLINFSNEWRYWNPLDFRDRLGQAWLGSNTFDGLGLVAATRFVPHVIFSAIAVLSLLLFIITASRALVRRQLSDLGLIQLTLGLALLSLSAVQITKNFYEARLYIPLLCFCFWSGLVETGFAEAAKKFIVPALQGLKVLSLFSLAYLIPCLILQFPVWLQDTKPISRTAVPVDYRGVRIERLRRLGAECGLAGGDAANLIIDDYSYFAFVARKLPLHMQFLSEWTEVSDIVAYGNSVGSPGFIGLCAWAEPHPWAGPGLPLRPDAQDGMYCCWRFGRSDGSGRIP